jgi:histidinol-phosphate aminotransferase
MRRKPSLTRRTFLSNASLGATSVSLALPLVEAAARYADPLPRSASEPVRLHRNESSYGLSPAAAQALKDAANRSHRYPIEEPNLLADVVARRLGVEKHNVLIACGSIEVLKMATESFCGPSRAAIVAEPTFEAVVSYCPFVHAKAVKVKLNRQYEHDLPGMLAASRQSGGMIFFCNPANPAGTFVDKQRVERFVRRLPRRVVLLADEAYSDYVDRPDFESCLRYVKEGLPVVVSRTLSKIYGMAGLRVGYAVGRKDLIEKMAARRLANNPNQLATAAAIAALNNDDAFVARVRKLNSEVRSYLYQQIRAMKLSYIPSESNFVMIDAGRPTKTLIEELKKRNILVGRPFPSMPNHIRVGLGTEAEIKQFLTQFQGVLNSPAAAGSK